MPYIIIPKVRKFHQSTRNRFDTAGEKTCRVGHNCPPPPSLNRVNQLDQSPESTPCITGIIMIDGGEIRRVKSIKYLGMIVDDKLSWERHIEFISEKNGT